MAAGAGVSVPDGDPADPIGLRVFAGPNDHFSWPAVELVLDVTALLAADPLTLAGPRRLVPGALARPGAAGSAARCRYLARVAACLTRAAAGAPRLPVVARPGPGPGQVLVAFPWRHRGRAAALGASIAAGMARLPRDDLGRVLADAARQVRQSASQG
ncbi:MAG: cyanophycin synthetase [Mycobacteriales bacterium]|jgi:cyanophycin synthetase